jgi:hypothetical protein
MIMRIVIRIIRIMIMRIMIMSSNTSGYGMRIMIMIIRIMIMRIMIMSSTTSGYTWIMRIIIDNVFDHLRVHMDNEDNNCHNIVFHQLSDNDCKDYDNTVFYYILCIRVHRECCLHNLKVHSG